MKPHHACDAGVGADGSLNRYQRGAHVGVQNEWAIYFVNLGGIAEVYKLLSLVGAGAFFIPEKRAKRKRKEISSIDEKVADMIWPDYDKIEDLSGIYNTIPICMEIYADFFTPITLLYKISQISRRYYLLESVEGGEKWARYSFLGFDPVLHVTCKDKSVTLEDHETKTIHTDRPFQVLRDLMTHYRAPRLDGMPPFTGGLVGYFAYAMIGYTEPVLKIKKDDTNDFDLMLFDKVIAYDHLKQKICIVVNMKTDHILENYRKARAELERIVRMITDSQPIARLAVDTAADFSCSISKETYCTMVEKAKQYIVDGDIFQAVISRRFVSDYHASLISAYRVLRTTNPSPYMVFMHLDDLEIMCSSPETLVRLQEKKLCTFPVAGSRPRGKTEAEDIALEKELLHDEKERSEHHMLIDLARNDLGRISKFSSVVLTDYMMIHRYSRIMHITSRVESEIRDDCDAFDALEAVLPAGTLSGAPKIRACEIIEELEPEPRGLYGGAIGYLDFTGNLDTCIAIRMAVKKNGKVYVQAGGGIVADSVPELEYAEAGNKAKAVIQAILQASEVVGG